MFYFSIKVILFLNACSEFIIRTIETLQTVSVATARARAPAPPPAPAGACIISSLIYTGR